MFEQCKSEYQAMMSRIEAVVKDKWPETLQGDGAIWSWLDEHRPELRSKHRSLNQQLNETWHNGILPEFKKLVTEWGRLQLEIFKGYAAFLKEANA